MTDQSLLISVIIPAFNAEQTLERTLAALEAQDLPDTLRFEVIVADDGSTDRTAEIAGSFGSPVRVLIGPNGGPSAARNRGAAEAGGQVLTFLDCDDTPGPEWLTQIATGFDGEDIGISTWPALTRDVSSNASKLLTPEMYGGLLYLQGCFAIRSDVFRAIGGYDPGLRFGENADLCERASAYCRAEGLQVRRLPATTVEIAFNQPPAHYDPVRLAAMEHLLKRDALQLATDPARRARIVSIAVVSAARCRKWDVSRRYARMGVRIAPLDPKAYARLVTALVPPLARRRWSGPYRSRLQP